MKVPVSRPHVGEKEIEYVNAALRAGAISGVFGEFLERFERGFAEFVGTRHAVSCSNGTTALHLALAALGIGPGDEVAASTLTNMATFFAILYTGATPIAIDVDPATLTMDAADLERKLTPKTKAVLVVHLFGQSTEMDPVTRLTKDRGIAIVEDCAESHGATYNGRKTGALGTIGCFSLFANKIFTTGEGGILTTDDAQIAERARSLKALAFGKTNKFMHTAVGFNYRMTNIQAAMGCAQLEAAEELIEKRREIAAFYRSRLAPYEEHLTLPFERPHARNVYWMYHLGLRGALRDKRDTIMRDLAAHGVETREGFIPFNLQEIFLAQNLTRREDCPNANALAYTTFYLPTGPAMTREELDYVADRVDEVFQDHLGR